MNGLNEIFKNHCLSVPTKDESNTREVLRGVIGRGGFGPRLIKWLEASRKIFPEIVRIEYPEASRLPRLAMPLSPAAVKMQKSLSFVLFVA